MANSFDHKFNLPIIEISDELLVSSPDNGGLCYVSGDLVTIIEGRASTGLFIDQRYLIWAYQEDGGRQINVIYNGTHKQVTLSDSPLDIHDIYFYNDQFYIVTTENNSVIQLDSNFEIVDNWQLPGEHDSVHINSVTHYRGQLIASLFGRFEQHRGYKSGTQGLGLVIDLHSGDTCLDGLSQPHSLTVVEDKLYLCSSEDKALHIYEGFQLKNKIPLPGYARGICLGKSHIYVGISISRNIDPDKHQLKQGSIVVIDNESMQPVGTAHIPFREIYDIRLVDNHQNLMAAVNHGQDSRDTRILELLKTLDLRNTSIQQLETGIKEYGLAKDELQTSNEKLQTSNNELQIGLKNYQTANQHLQLELEKMLSSSSWRLTKPLRFIENLSKSDANN